MSRGVGTIRDMLPIPAAGASESRTVAARGRVRAWSEPRTAPRLHWAVRSEAGPVRPHNEDACAALGFDRDAGALLVLADGMGGYHAGEVASRLAVDTIVAALQPELGQRRPAGEGAEPLVAALAKANAAILSHAARRADCLGMGTTAVVALVRDGELVHAHVGDSRLYLQRGGRLRRLTRDHSLGEVLVNTGEAPGDAPQRAGLRGVLTRALGPEAIVQPDAGATTLLAGDWLVLCSDGLTDHVDDARIQAVLAQADRLDAHDRRAEAACHALVEAALADGGSDNVSVIALRVTDEHGH